MVKKLFTFTMGLMLTVAAMAQASPKSITFSASDIQYWVGTGSNQAVVIIGWDDNPSNNNFALAWGVRWNGTATAANMLDTISTYDSRVTYTIGTGFVTYIGYNDGTLISGSEDSYWCYTINGLYASAYGIQTMTNNDLMEISSSCNFDLDTAIAATNPNGVTEGTIAANDIEYWVGNGSNELIFAINWVDTALAWGYRFSDSTVLLSTVMSDIQAADPRFSYTMGSYGVDDILFIDNNDTLRGTTWWSHYLNGAESWGMGSTLRNGDFSRWFDPATAVVVDSTYHSEYGGYWSYNYVCPQTIYPVSAPAMTDATIPESAILYWVGTGENKVRFIVNWADTALAWGYRFDSDSVIASDMMEAIAAADPRLSITDASTGFITDIVFVDNNDTLAITPGQYWMYNYNGEYSYNYINQQSVFNGDVIKFGDLSVATGIGDIDDWGYYASYIWTMPVYPVSVPTGPNPFCGAVGTEGCDAIAGNSSLFKAWATGCTVTRGYQNIAQPEMGMVSYGTDSMAIGAVNMNDNLSVVSLGDGGSALLSFAHPITNGEGPDFAVFENSFDDHFLELAFVEVSTDGEHFVRFPATSYTQTTTQTGPNGSTDPTMINNLAGKYRMGYGTPFDLEELRDSSNINVDSILYVRIVDVVGSIDPQYGTTDQYGNLINDPWPNSGYSAGFDLDGIGVIHQLTTSSIDEAQSAIVSVYPNPATDRINIVAAHNANAELYDFTGRRVAVFSFNEGVNTISLANINPGVYMLRIGESVSKIVKR